MSSLADGVRERAIYVASKHALVGLTETMAIEAFNVDVCPGLTETAIQDRVWAYADERDAFVARSVQGRTGTAEEIARVVGFLTSDDASCMPGHALLADGGYTILSRFSPRDRRAFTPS